MKKITTTIGFLLLMLTFVNAQNNQKEDNFDDMSKQMAQMQKLMAEQIKKMFGTEGVSDSTQSFNFSFKSLPFGQLDTSMTQSFGMLFDGKNWQNLSPNGDTSMNQSLQELRDRMPDFGKGMNIDDLFKSFGDMFQNGALMSPNPDDMPRVQPKKRKAEEPKKNSKYKTESL
jgi:hypothetical protein